MSDQLQLDTRRDAHGGPEPPAQPPHFYAAPRIHPQPGDLCARCSRPSGDPIHLKPRAS